MAFDVLGAATLGDHREAIAMLLDERAHALGIGLELG
jgi:hypothetical protein